LGTDDYALINDVSLAEIRIEQCSFTNSSRGISKENGLLTLKCDDFENIQFSAVEVLNCGLNMSSNSNAGFNVFTDVGTCLNLNNATLLNLENGVNDFSGASDNVISGTLDISCDSECGAELIATNNYWGEDPIYQPYYYNPSSSAVHIDLLTSYESGVLCGGGFGNTGQCEVTLLDEEPAMPLGCDITYLPVSGIVRSMNTTPSDDEFLATQNQVASISDMASTDLTGADAKTFEGWILFPNPVKDVLSVSCSFGGVWDCAMYDLVGQLVQSDLQNFTPSATIQLNVSSLIPGYYFVEFNNGIQSHRFKFVKE
jgi:hypothetical protein